LPDRQAVAARLGFGLDSSSWLLLISVVIYVVLHALISPSGAAAVHFDYGMRRTADDGTS
jgi:hypothetical protein